MENHAAICAICGGTRFDAGPGGRMAASSAPPRCTDCRSLERHRAVRNFFNRVYDKTIFGRLKVLQFSKDASIRPEWFGRYEVSIYGKKNSLDIQDIDRPSGTYDLIICNHVLEHVPDEAAALRELLRVVNDDGAVFLSVPDPCRRPVTVDWGFADERRNGHYRHYGADIVDRFKRHLPGAFIVQVEMFDEVTGTPDVAFVLASRRNALVDHIVGRSVCPDDEHREADKRAPMENLAEYLNGTFTTVEGWCLPQLWQVIEPIARSMQANGGIGPVAEIGVHHGKFFFGLLKTMESPKSNYAIDVFDMQLHNVDRSGKGNYEKFMENMDKSKIGRDRVQVLKTDSTLLTEVDAANLREKTGGFTFFSVDGCHMPEHTIHDMNFAMRCTRADGIIFIDDYYNVNWPGVQEGVSKFYHSNAATFIPLAYSCNKLLLCHMSHHAQYLEEIRDFVSGNFPGTRMKQVKRFGYDNLNILPDMKNGLFLSSAS